MAIFDGCLQWHDEAGQARDYWIGGRVGAVWALMEQLKFFLGRSQTSLSMFQSPFPLYICELNSKGRRQKMRLASSQAVIWKIDAFVGFKCAQVFIYDSCNGMRDVRNKLGQQNVVPYAYECVTNWLNNFCENVWKALFYDTIKRALFVSNTVIKKGFTSKFFQRLCE